MHNVIQELKGNIRVYVRLRPKLGENELLDPFDPYEYVADSDNRGLEVTGLPQESYDGRSSQARNWKFEFDRVFTPHC